MTNPLLDFSDLPRFDQIRPEHVAPAMDDLLASAESALATVTAPDFPAKWTSIATVLDVATERLGRAWGAVAHLNSVADTPELRAAFNAVLPKVTEFWTRLGADERLFAKYKSIDPSQLNHEQRQAHRNALRNFVLGGAELTGADRERFARIQERQAELAQKFSENALDATDAFSYLATEAELDGVPSDVKQTARAATAAEGKDGYKLTLKMPCYLPVMQFAKRSALRQVLYRAYVTRASDQAEGEAIKFDNSALIGEILALRQEEARLLGYVNFGEVSVVPKMAESPQQIISFPARPRPQGAPVCRARHGRPAGVCRAAPGQSDITNIASAVMMLGVDPFFRQFDRPLTLEGMLSGQPQALLGVLQVILRTQRASRYAHEWAFRAALHER
jgi:oligopeptidase A